MKFEGTGMRIGKKLTAVAVWVAMVAGPGLPATAQAPLADTAVLRGAHLSPDTPSVDVYLTGFAGHTTTLWLSSVGYGDVSPYRRIQAGLYAVSMRAHGAKASSPAALSWTINLRAGRAYTAAAVGMNSALHGIIVPDQLTRAQPGSGRIRVIQAASRAPQANVSAAQDPNVSRSVRFGSVSPYMTVAAGRLSVRAASAASPSVVANADVAIQSGGVGSVLVLDAKKHEGITIRYLVDAAGASVVPTGAVPAGGGGTARIAGGSDRPVLVLAISLLAVGLVVAGTRRRKRAAGRR